MANDQSGWSPGFSLSLFSNLCFDLSILLDILVCYFSKVGISITFSGDSREVALSGGLGTVPSRGDSENTHLQP